MRMLAFSKAVSKTISLVSLKIYSIVAFVTVVAILCSVSFYAWGSGDTNFTDDKLLIMLRQALQKQNISHTLTSQGFRNLSNTRQIISEIPQEDAKILEKKSKCRISSKMKKIPDCNIKQHDLTPCTDPRRWKKFSKQRMIFRERHCPSVSERPQCLVPPPEGYKIPIKWPKSRDECWYKNIPSDWIDKEKGNQNWLHREGEKFLFPGGGTMFSDGVDKYLNQMELIIPGMKDGSIRTALDTGCGVASWGGYLLDRGIITMSLAPRDNHQAQVQFALERGIPAMLGLLATQRLPFPANAFDMAHCSRCLIPWTRYGGASLLEVDRVIRPGGFWVLSGPPVNYETHWQGWGSSKEKQKADLDAIQELLSGMCYKLYGIKRDIAVWQKPINNNCYNKREPVAYPPLCNDSISPDSAWYVATETCIVHQPEGVRNSGIGQLALWPKRLFTVPERLKLFTENASNVFNLDSQMWATRVQHYKKVLPDLGTSNVRNVMDMNTKYGGFAAALVGDPVWVMNVVSSHAKNTLGVVYDRGLIGTLNDWCEAFSTYPRSYDLLHVAGLFSEESGRCEMKFVMLEMDRILRPKGYVIISDLPEIIQKAGTIGDALRWDCYCNETEKGSLDTHVLLLCQKQFWTSRASR